MKTKQNKNLILERQITQIEGIICSVRTWARAFKCHGFYRKHLRPRLPALPLHLAEQLAKVSSRYRTSLYAVLSTHPDNNLKRKKKTTKNKFCTSQPENFPTRNSLCCCCCCGQSTFLECFKWNMLCGLNEHVIFN